MERSPFLPLPEGMVIGQVEIAEAQLTVEVISTQPFAHCPGCGSPSDHVHCQVSAHRPRCAVWGPSRRPAALCAQVLLPRAQLPAEGVY
jgi:hypothetical protein